MRSSFILGVLAREMDNGIIPDRLFANRMRIGRAIDDGNCLFHSISQLLPANQRMSHQEIRHALCQFYKRFRVDGTYPDESFESKMQLQMMADNEEEDGLHQDNICKDQEWAGLMDVLALTHLLKLNIIVLSKVKGGYTIQPYLYQDSAPVMCVKYNGTNHFEHLYPKFGEDSLSHAEPVQSNVSKEGEPRFPLQPHPFYEKEEKEEKEDWLTPEKGTALADAQSVSPETKRLLGIAVEPTHLETQQLLDPYQKKERFGRGAVHFARNPAAARFIASDARASTRTKRCLGRGTVDFTRNTAND